MTQKISSVNIEASTLSSFTGPLISTVSIANSSYVIVDDTAVSNAGGYAVISGNNFVSGAQVLFGSTSATSVTYVDSSTLRVEVPALTAGSYVMYVQNPDGSTAIRLNGITSSPTPVWGTDSTLTPQDAGTAFSISLAASSDSNVTFSLSSGSTLPPGTTLAANGLFSGTVTIEEETTYNFSVDAIDAENQETLRSFSVTVATGDANYKDTVLHLSGETSNNTWITDASVNSFAPTISGDARPVAFSPYETVWSNSFDGTDDYLTIPTNSAFNLPGDFTMECWAYWNALPGNSILLDTYIAGDNGSYQLYWRSTGSSIAFYTPGDGVILQDPSSSTIVVNKWYHIAVTRSGTTARLFIDGVEKASATLTRDLTHDNDFTIGIQKTTSTNDINGYISNVRLIKGTALYTSNFTPSTTPLTAVANTVLLTCQSNRFIDNSTNNFAITKGNNTSVSNFGPFVETDVTTGSGYFDGTGDYLSGTLPVGGLGSGNFCIEGWIYPITRTTGDNGSFIDTRSGTTVSTGAVFGLTTTNGYPFVYTGGGFVCTASIAPPLNSWSHLAYVRNGSTVTIYLNGISIVTGTTSNNLSDRNFTIATVSAGTATYYQTYISNFRVVVGSAVYTTTFTPPASPLTAITNTSLLTLQSRIGENNNRFVDASGINNLITRNGNATQGTFSPFAVTGWSNYFDGTGDALYPPDAQAALTPGSSATATYTVEGWYYLTGVHKNYNALWDWRTTGFGGGYYLRITSGGYLQLADSATVWTDTVNYINQNTWYHVTFTVVSNGTSSHTYNVYLNGNLIKTGTNTTNSTSGRLTIGSNTDRSTHTWQGYISNFRVVNGTEVYTSTFTPPTSDLTAITNTSLLTCQSNRLIDNSTNNFTITKVGDVSVQPFSPFKPTDSWSPTTVGGSMLFDGTGDFLTIPNNAALNPGTQDFVMEAWVYIRALTGSNQGFNGKGTAGTDGYSFYVTNGLVLSFIWNGTGGATITAGTLKLNAWHHVAVVRNSGVIRLYLDGVGAGSSTSCTTDITTTGVKYIGLARGGNPVNGYMAGYRMIKGQLPTGYDATASTITVPTAPFEALKSTSLLLNGTSGGIIDYTGRNNLETVGDAKIRNNVVKYGSGAMYFDGTDDYLLIPANSNLEFGSGDFTIEFWWYPTSTTRQALYHGSFGTDWSLGIDYSSTSTNQKIGIWASSNGTSWNLINADAGGNGIGTTTITQNAWNHIAYVRNGTTWMLFVNGNRDLNLTGISGSIINRSTSSKVIGTWWNTTAMSEVFGYIDDFRISKVARYTDNFTPPTAEFKTK